MPKYKVLVAQFPGCNVTHIEPTKWVAATLWKMGMDPRIGAEGVAVWDKADTPITMTRNQALIHAEMQGADYVVMIDSDMHPDVIGPKDGGKPFWETSWEFILNNKCGMIAAPYCGPPPNEHVYIFRWNTDQDQRPNPNMRLEMYDRHTAMTKLGNGIEKVAALPTGLCIIDMQAVRALPHPRFDYEWKDRYGNGEKKCETCCSPIPGERAQKASTEDVYFSRNLWYAGWPVHCNWDAWAGHYKQKLVGPPQNIPVDSFPQMMRKWSENLPTAKIPDPYPTVGQDAVVEMTAADGVQLPLVQPVG